MTLVLVTAPTVPILTAAEARARLGIGSDVSDAVLDAHIKAATQVIDGGDGWLGRALLQQVWKLTLDEFPNRYRYDRIRIPLPPLISIDSINFIDTAGVEQSLDPGAYRKLAGEPATIEPVNCWPRTKCQGDAVSITFTCGYGTTADKVPEPVRNAVALGVSELRSLQARNLMLAEDTVEGLGTKRYIVSPAMSDVIQRATNALLSTYRIW